ncbi:Hypothetical predicted protein, partial [Mytilus galloprovincialis]
SFINIDGFTDFHNKVKERRNLLPSCRNVTVQNGRGGGGGEGGGGGAGEGGRGGARGGGGGGGGGGEEGGAREGGKLSHIGRCGQFELSRWTFLR